MLDDCNEQHYRISTAEIQKQKTGKILLAHSQRCKKTLPYAKLICETLIETYEYIETFPTQEEREKHLKEMEGAVFEQYKPVLKKFTKSQAKMLIKLIKRETNQSSYNILKLF